MLVSIFPCFPGLVDHHGFASFVLRCAFDPAVAYLAYYRSVEVDWSFIEGVHRWFPY